MEYRELGRTGVKVSAICLGTMTWGEQNTEAEGHAQMDYALDRGVNFFDVAEMYPSPPKAETAGRTEEIIGSWFSERGNRDKVVLATKVAGRSGMTWLRRDGEEVRLTRAQIMEAIDGSLRRLRTDYVDLYQVHWPDRPMDLFGGRENVPRDGGFVPFEETLDALSELVQAGKVRHVGVSNETPWGTMHYLHLASNGDRPRMVSIQNAYNLLNRTYEDGLAEIAFREQVGLLAYSPLAQGYLSGKYQDGALPAGARKTLFNRLQRYETPGADTAITAYLDLARRHGIDPSHLAIQFVTTRPFVTSNIIGATSLEQLKTDIDSIDLDFNDELESEVEAIHQLNANPCP